VTVFDVVEEDGSPWIVMELIRARPLDQVIAEDGPLPPARAAQLGLGLLDALSTAHKAGVLHRDVKPSNVLISPNGKAVLTDFGIATIQGDPGLTQAGMVVGTPGFSPPERVRGATATPASDLWSLGATLYAAVEGRGPFDRAGGSAAIVASIATEPAPRAPSAGPLAPVIDALLRADPAERPDAAATGRMLTQAWRAARVAERVPMSGSMVSGPGAIAQRGRDLGSDSGLGPGGSELTTATQVVVVPEDPASAGGSRSGSGSGSGSGERTDDWDLDDGLAALGAAAATGVVPDLMATPNFADLKMPDLDRAGELALNDGDLVVAGTEPGAGVGAGAAGEATATTKAGGAGDGSGSGSGSGPGSGAGSGGRRSVRAFVRSRRGLAILAPLLVVVIAGVVIRFAFPNVSATLGRLGGGIAGQDHVAARFNHGTQGGHAPRSGRSAGSHAASGKSGPGQPSPKSSGSGKAKPKGKPSASGRPKPSSSGKPSSTPKPSHSVTPTPKPSVSPTPTPIATAPPPAGYVWDQVTATQAGTLAGFRLAGPEAWAVNPGLNTVIKPASGPGKLDVNMATWAVKGPVRQARRLQAKARAAGKYRRYHLVSISGTKFDGWPAARWTFWWQPKAGGIIDVTMLLFTAQTWEGPQQYILLISSPDSQRSTALSIFQTAKNTFKPLPG
jgi:eukaryotic-like serine/threonine-protein kinase